MNLKKIALILSMVACACVGLLAGVSISDENTGNENMQCVEARQFESYLELVDWLRQDNTDRMEYIPDTFDCEDFAMMLQRNALKDGYIISMELIDYDGDGHLDHAKNTAVIGNNIWLIEPQTDSVYLYATCD